MKQRASALLKWLGRTAAILLLVIMGSTILVRFAPGYLSDAREMDTRYSGVVRAELSGEAARSHSLLGMLASEIKGWVRGDAGISRQYGIPVTELIGPRLKVTGSLLLQSVLLGWALALSVGLAASLGRRPSFLWQIPATLLLAVPTAAMATICLLSNSGGPVLVMSLLLAARDFKFVDRALRSAWLAPHLLHARAQGLATPRLLVAHMLPALLPQLYALAGLSLVTALSALVPVEVIFNVPGLGELAWNAALNRDLPVLLAVTVIMALAVTLSGKAFAGAQEWKNA